MANNQKIADKKKANYQEALEKSHADVQHEAVQLHERPGEKSCTSRKSYMKDSEKSRADSAARSCESYLKDPEKSCADIAAGSREIYKKDLENSR